MKKGIAGVLITGAMLYSTGAKAAPAAMATGHVSFTSVASTATLQFSVRESSGNLDAGGVFRYTERSTDGSVNYYTLQVECVDVTNDTATFSGRIVDSSMADWVGSGVQIWVRDSGQPGGEGDAFAGALFDWVLDDPATEDVDESEANCLPIDEVPAWIEADRGNIVVHSGQVGHGYNR